MDTFVFFSGVVVGASVAFIVWGAFLLNLRKRDALDEAKRRGSTRAMGKAYQEAYVRTHADLRESVEAAARKAGW